MTAEEKSAILSKAKHWFTTTIANNHIVNTKKLIDIEEFNLNPFLLKYLANYYSGEISARSLAEILILPRVLGTSINTSFGTNFKKFISDVLKGTYGSLISGMDIEFTDYLDGVRKYCQIKAGPNTINKDDVTTIVNHFNAAIRLGRTNGVTLNSSNLFVGVIYGEREDLSGHYYNLERNNHYQVIIGKDFWHRLTGDENFYKELINAISEIAIEFDSSTLLKGVINELSMSNKLTRLAN